MGEVCENHGRIRCGECAYIEELKEHLAEKEAEIERLRKALKDTLAMISQSDQMSKCDQRVWSEYVELSKGIKGGETDATKTSD